VLEALLHDLHVEEAEEPAPEAEAERGGGLRLVLQARIVQLELLERVAQNLEVVRVARINAREHHRLDLLVSGQHVRGAAPGIEDRVAHARVRHSLDLGGEVAHLTGEQLLHGTEGELHVADLIHVVCGVPRAEPDAHPRSDGAIDDSDEGDGAAVLVVMGVEDEGPEGRLRISGGRGDAAYDRVQEIVDALAELRRYRDHVGR
jgi:hypothetical protein